MIVLLSLLIAAAYLGIGVALAIWDTPRVWQESRRRLKGCTEDFREGMAQTTVRAIAVTMLLFWPIRGAYALLARATDGQDPKRIEQQLKDRDSRIAELERELGVRP